MLVKYSISKKQITLNEIFPFFLYNYGVHIHFIDYFFSHLNHSVGMLLYIKFSLVLAILLHHLRTIIFWFQHFLAGYRMAAECARNALLEKVMDNKADTGAKYDLLTFKHQSLIMTCHLLVFINYHFIALLLGR